MKKHAQLYPLFLEDFTLIGLIILISLTLIGSLWVGGGSEWALIYENNRLIDKIELGKQRVYPFKKMIIEVNEKKIRVKSSNCPEQICVHRGWIDTQGEIIVCAPNHVLIEIKGQKGTQSIYAP